MIHYGVTPAFQCKSWTRPGGQQAGGQVFYGVTAPMVNARNEVRNLGDVWTDSDPSGRLPSRGAHPWLGAVVLLR
jgi:hypothetical protein